VLAREHSTDDRNGGQQDHYGQDGDEHPPHGSFHFVGQRT
jgi:hypothetical protein